MKPERRLMPNFVEKVPVHHISTSYFVCFSTFNIFYDFVPGQYGSVKRPFRAFPIFANLVPRKRLAVDRNEQNVGRRFLVVQGNFDYDVFKIILRSFGSFLIFDKLVSRKRLVVERNGSKLGPRG